MSRLSQSQLELAVGGAVALAQLLDLDGDDIADPALVSMILDEVDGEANSYISPAVDVGDTTIDTAPQLLRKELDCAVYLAWLRGSKAQAMPESVKVARDDALRWYNDVRERRASLGMATRPTTSQPIRQVTKSSDEAWFSESGPRRRFDGWA